MGKEREFTSFFSLNLSDFWVCLKRGVKGKIVSEKGNF